MEWRGPGRGLLGMAFAKNNCNTLKTRCSLAIATAMLLAACGEAERLPFDGDSVVGQVRSVRLDRTAKAIDVARRYAIAVGELARANPHVPGLAGGQLPAGT